MGSLSPATWILVGLIVTAVSALLPNIRFFIFIGVLFMIVGVVKLAVQRKKEPVEHKYTHTYHQHKPRMDTPKNVQANPKKCFVCGGRAAATDNFCGHCGHRI